MREAGNRECVKQEKREYGMKETGNAEEGLGMRETRAEQIKWFVRAGVLFAAALFLVIGVMRQEYLDVWQKAVKICLECVGIG